ncbi:helix-turn-helix domain-containing protein [Gordonibacter massiliensis (ex Traore et al. 2017)]|uniref:Helix-turn-helix transcriptional regulator n=1 Tax=Gordonibacter massiliensis (ex Traore et al. 2017) TaxID=1841863 RepID=A0A842J817_9ACTN|nr:helix-turn-helix transcriptional regulator [Gordonibacter massiliensis (ex Traore et al. 2017)]MBC2888142.1 helix-turn-helix transcriptional regulator [Gordonibacter massiliensis (ex Traore et al. 2017)]
MIEQRDNTRYFQTKRKLGLRISMLREEKGVSRREFAKSLGMDHVNLWKIEEGNSNVKLDTLCKIAEGLGVEVEQLFCD